MHQHRFFSRIAPVYDRAMRIRRLRGVPAFVGPIDGRIVELGGGTGLVTQALIEANPDATALVLDANVAMLRHADEKGFATVAGDAERTPLASGAADVVVIAEALHHFPSPEAALLEAARLLRPDGRLFIDDFHPRSLVMRLFVRTAERLIGSPFTVRHPDEIRAHLEKNASMAFVDGRRLGYRYWQLYRRR